MLKAYIDQKVYADQKGSTYAEVQLQFVGYTLGYLTVEGGLQSSVAIQIAITNMNGDTVVKDAYALKSPIMRDSVIEDFFDIARYPMNAGKYDISISLMDIVRNSAPMDGKLELDIPVIQNKNALSDILVAEVAVKTIRPSVFSKSGYDIIPRISNFFPSDLNAIPYYVEIYNTHLLPDSLFALRQRIVETTKNTEIESLTRLTKLKTDSVVPMFRKLDITNLPTGSYLLELAIVDRNNVQKGEPSMYFFERVNDVEAPFDAENIVLDPDFQASITDDSLKFYIASLLPIARPSEARSILDLAKKGTPEKQRNYMQSFWVQTAGAKAAEAWYDYKKNVLFAQRIYKNNFQDGFETDRGRVFLQYGPPNSIQSHESNPSEYPYEIWHYYKIKKYSNKRFIFYNPDLVQNNHRLLHSDMVGELQNYRWQQALSIRNSPGQNIDDPNDGNKPSFGGNSNYNYRQY